MRDVNEQIRNQIKALKEQYIDKLTKNFQLDYVLGQLESQLKSPETENTPDAQLNDHIFPEFLTDSQLSELRLIGKDKSKDSTFVLSVVRQLYANNLSIVKNKSVCGRKNKKEPMTPEKSNVLKEIFNQRLKSCQSTDTESRLLQLTINIPIMPFQPFPNS